MEKDIRKLELDLNDKNKGLMLCEDCAYSIEVSSEDCNCLKSISIDSCKSFAKNKMLVIDKRLIEIIKSKLESVREFGFDLSYVTLTDIFKWLGGLDEVANADISGFVSHDTFLLWII